jgi:TolA-binding protein
MLTALLLTAGLAQTRASAPPGLDVAPGDLRVWQLNEAMRARRDAARQIASSPGTVAAFRAFIELGREDDALDALMGIVERRPREVADALPALTSGLHFSDGARDYAARFRAIFAAAREKAAQLPREEAATLELAIAGAESMIERGSEAWRTRATAFVARYPGTHAAAMAEIQLATFDTMARRFDTLDAIARAHPGTDIAAAAIYQKGFDLAHNAFVTGPDRQPDPTDRFQRVLAIVDELESGQYPKGEWVDKAPSLVVEFNSYKPEYTPEHLDVMLAGYRAVVKRHLTPDPLNPLSNQYGYVITSRMAELFKLKGDADGVDRTLRELEADSPDRQWAGYLRALRTPRGATRVELLEAIASSAGNRYAPKALATLALDELQQGNAAAARDRFRSFIARYPRSEYAWIAAMHAAEADLALGDAKAAEQGFAAAAQTYSAAPAALVLGRALAAHAAQVTGQSARAADHYAAALGGWDRETFEVSLYTTREAPTFRRTEIARRTETLRAMLAQPGGEIVERGRWQLTNGDRPGAIASFETALARFPSSPAAPLARLLLHRAQTEAALDLGNIERPDADPKAAESRLDALAREPADSAVIAARIARASMRWSAGDTDGARTAMGAALGDWIAAQPHAEPQSDLERDAAAIRDASFLPLGGGILGNRGWNAFTWPAALPPFLLIDPAITVKLASGDLTTVTVTRPVPGYANVVFADETMQALLERTMIALGGTKRRQPTGIMETPNQPAGESTNILAFWNTFFPARAGHWGGWEFTSYPRLTRIEFLDAARTRAAANVTIGYSGVTIVLEKRGTTWTPVRLTNQWIT